MTSSYVRMLSLPLVAAISSFGCAAPPDPAITGALVTGRVSSDEGASSGVAVRAYGVAPDGTMTPASDTGTTTADGRYSLRIDLDDAATRLVVRVQDGTERMTSLGRASLGVVDSTATHIVLAPIDARSGMVASIDLALEEMEDVSLEESASSSLFLSIDASTRLAATPDQATIDAAALAVAGARATFVRALDPSIAGAGDAHAALSVIAIEEGTLATRLDTATSASDVDAAYTAYLDASIAAVFDAGYSREAMAAAAISMESALEAGIGSRMSAGHAELRELGAFAVTSSIDEGLGASFESTAITSASASLRTSVVAMAGAGATSDEMTAAWVSYGDVVEAELSARAGLVATLVDMIGVDVTAATFTLEATWSEQATGASATDRVQAYTDFHAAIDTTANLELLTVGGVDADQAHLILTSMGDISAATH
jgi:hypothetical protein